MKRETRISIIILIVTALSIIISAIFLPDTVRVQGSVITGYSTDLPKLWAILLATILSITGAIGIHISKKAPPAKYNTLILSVIGMIWFVYIILVNCLPTIF